MQGVQECEQVSIVLLPCALPLTLFGFAWDKSEGFEECEELRGRSSLGSDEF